MIVVQPGIIQHNTSKDNNVPRNHEGMNDTQPDELAGWEIERDKKRLRKEERKKEKRSFETKEDKKKKLYVRLKEKKWVGWMIKYTDMCKITIKVHAREERCVETNDS